VIVLVGAPKGRCRRQVVVSKALSVAEAIVASIKRPTDERHDDVRTKS